MRSEIILLNILYRKGSYSHINGCVTKKSCMISDYCGVKFVEKLDIVNGCNELVRVRCKC